MKAAVDVQKLWPNDEDQTIIVCELILWQLPKPWCLLWPAKVDLLYMASSGCPLNALQFGVFVQVPASDNLMFGFWTTGKASRKRKS